MKKKILLLGFVMSFVAGYSQINLEYTLKGENRTAPFDAGSKGLMYYSYVGNYVLFYNEDHSLYKEIEVNQLSDYYISVLYPSERLFNSDTLLEFICVYHLNGQWGTSAVTKILILNEMGTIIKDFGTYNGGTKQVTVFSVGNTSKLMISDGNSVSADVSQAVTEYYSLPGSATSISSIPLSDTMLKAFPNPAKTIINLVYTLKSGKSSVMNIFSANGQLVEKKRIDSNFDSVKLNVSNYNAGVYFYQYDGLSEKFIVE